MPASILVVDDENSITNALELLLRDHGYEVSLMPEDLPEHFQGLPATNLNAVITGPGRGPFNHYPPNPVEPDRNQPFREFTTVYHDEIFAVQAFPQFEESEDGISNPLAFTLHSVRDAFAINYGTGGIGAEILANRFGVGSMAKCTECLFEEFFLFFVHRWRSGDDCRHSRQYKRRQWQSHSRFQGDQSFLSA